MKFCPFCGRELEKDFSFCPFCGKKLKLADEPKEEIIEVEGAGIEEKIVAETDAEIEEPVENSEVVSRNDHNTDAFSSDEEESVDGSDATEAINEENAEKYHFDNIEEFIIYTQKFNHKGNVIWVSPEEYVAKVKKAYNLFERQRFQDALDCLNEALELNPVGIGARFEMCETYIRLHKYNEAEEVLMNLMPFLYDDSLKARFYRRLGYIMYDRGRFDEAGGCYLYSLKYETSPSAMKELQLIKPKMNRKTKKKSAVDILIENKLPILLD